MKMLISKSYFYLKETPDEIHSRQFFSAFRPFSSGGSYASFLAYPKLIIDSSVKKLQAIRKEEEVILEEQMKALNIKQRLEKKLRSEDKTEGHERIYRGSQQTLKKANLRRFIKYPARTF